MSKLVSDSLKNNAEVGSIVKGIWLNILDQEEVEHSVDFFAIGGTSIKAARMLAQICRQMDLRLKFIDFYESPYYATLISMVESAHFASNSIEGPGNFVELFYDSVEKFGNQAALVVAGEEITYDELNRKSNQVAWHLIDKGMDADQIVGVYLPRTLELLVVLIGVLKSGAAYLPLDIRFPKNRIVNMIKAAKCSYVITDSIFENQINAITSPLIISEILSPEQHLKKVINPNIKISSNHLAYVIFTSGTTGEPKGVMIEHKSLASLLLSMLEITETNNHDRWLATTSVSFDISTVELYLPLIAGASLYLAPENLMLDPYEFSSIVKQQKITWLQATPSAFSIICEDDETFALNALVGGEPLPNSLSERIIEKGFKLINMYGPSETTVWSTYFVLEQTYSSHYAPIGKPLSEESCYILDDKGKEVADGEIGELYIAGIGLARGYLNQLDTSQEKFIQRDDLNIPVSDKSKKRLYKTGDLVVKQPGTGILQYVGRIDDQVKINGFRVEVAEIVANLLKIEAMVDCIVLAETSKDNNEKKLLAFCVYSDQALELSTINIRERLAEDLPWYMIPSQFITIDRLPLMINGKVDKSKLYENLNQQRYYNYE